MNSTTEKTRLHFSNGILTISFTENAIVEVEDIIYIHCYAMQESNGKSYGVLFDSSSTHEFSEEAIVYFADGNHINKIIAMAYISKTLLSKIRLNLLMIFERPILKPKIFDNETSAYQWLRQQVDEFEEAHP